MRQAQSFEGQGLEGTYQLDWAALIKRKRVFTDPATRASESWLTSRGVTLLHGHAQMRGPDSIEVDGNTYVADTFVVASGSRPLELGIPGEELLTTSDRFMELESLPQRIVFVGGGYISFEFASLAAATGSKVTILHRSEQVLKGFDPDLARMLVDRYATLGIDVVTHAEVRSISAHGSSLAIETDRETYSADLAVHGAGRVAAVDRLNLEVSGVEFDRRGVLVNEHLRSISNPHFYAAGDAASIGEPLSPVATRQGLVVADNITGHDRAFDGSATPSVVYSDPPLARVGRDAEESADVEVIFNDTSAWFTQRRLGHTHAAAKVVIEKSSGRVLGAHLLGPNAEEVINVFALAVRQGLTASQLKDMIWAYPTAGSDIVYLL